MYRRSAEVEISEGVETSVKRKRLTILRSFLVDVSLDEILLVLQLQDDGQNHEQRDDDFIMDILFKKRK